MFLFFRKEHMMNIVQYYTKLYLYNIKILQECRTVLQEHNSSYICNTEFFSIKDSQSVSNLLIVVLEIWNVFLICFLICDFSSNKSPCLQGLLVSPYWGKKFKILGGDKQRSRWIYICVIVAICAKDLVE